MMKTQVTILAALLILVALTSNLDMVAEAQGQLGPGDCFDGCITGCVQRDTKKMIKCERRCAKKCGRGKILNF
ncbi:hypothetical protein EUTSA_v10009246mg [Eutrema salsugineum]|uniref:Thionin-like protein n=1 Tax=Eutrema salsugineum TaxID=72664 RepID=V4MR44_EUTSA|nr:hypothetical protein EUTSA_v10009246mg [Eutrema salsugineum]ESQ34202.1 hypothetical protein EUTSA_v10009246mg [Eutrema salsugineum]